MAIVLPDGIFSNPSAGYIREWVKKRAEILAVIDCPHNTFMPHTHTKTSVLVLRRWQHEELSNYPIMMSVVEKYGHNTRGKELYVEDGSKLDEEFSEAADMYIDHPARVFNQGEHNRLAFTRYEGSLSDGILVPRYYDPDTSKRLERLKRSGDYELVQVQELVDEHALSITNVGATASGAECTIYDSIPFFRTSDVGAWETRNYTVQNVNEETYLRYKGKQDLQEGDILFVKDGTYRIGESIVLTRHDLKMLVQNHFLKLRVLKPDMVSNYYLLYLLHVPIVQKQIAARTFVQSTISTIGSRLNEVRLPFHKDTQRRSLIKNNVRNCMIQRARERQRLKAIFRQHEA